MHRLPFILLTLALLATVSPPATADIPARHLRHSATMRHFSLLPLRAEMDIGGRIFDELQWIDRDTVIAHANMPDGFFITPYRINLRTGQFHVIKLKPAVWNCKPAHWSLSPDKKWVLWRMGRYDTASTTYAARLDGRGSRSWDNHGSRSWSVAVDSGADVLWLPHSHRWVGFRVRQTDTPYTYEAALIHDLNNPKAPPHVVPLPAAVKSARNVVGVLPDGRILMVKYPDDSPHSAAATAKLFLIDLHAPKRMQQITITLPAGTKEVSAIYLSPNGRSLAWKLCACDERAEKTAFYVSDLNGHKMRLVKLPPIESDEGFDLQGWYSDSRSLLFEVRQYFQVRQDKEIPKKDYLCWVAVPKGEK